MGAISGSAALMCTLAGSLALGIVYSCDLPLLRWKKYPVLAAACVLSVRAVAVQLGFFLHILHYTPLAAGAEGLHSAAFVKLLQGPLGFTMGFMLLFSIVIALFKDIPDTKGDIQVSDCCSPFSPSERQDRSPAEVPPPRCFQSSPLDEFMVIVNVFFVHTPTGAFAARCKE